ncbi:hypothetical protein BHM03_00013606 [Ensete ventricosum]|nr:hypothetical protein BHM03_00013606 [Ensete ventricosum]
MQGQSTPEEPTLPKGGCSTLQSEDLTPTRRYERPSPHEGRGQTVIEGLVEVHLDVGILEALDEWVLLQLSLEKCHRLD